MKDKYRADKFEVKLQNTRVNKDVNKVQRDVHNFERRRLSAVTFSLKKKREMKKRNIKVTKRNSIKEERKATYLSARNQTTRKIKLTSMFRH